jgi:hypothetical protein
MGGGVGVDVVHPYASAADDAEPGGGLEELGVGLDGGADDEGVGVGEFGGEAVFNLVRRDYVPAGFLLEYGEGGGRDFFGENDLHGSSYSSSSLAVLSKVAASTVWDWEDERYCAPPVYLGLEYGAVPMNDAVLANG